MSTDYTMAKRGDVEFYVIETSGRLSLGAVDNRDVIETQCVTLDVTHDEAIEAAAKLLYAVMLNSPDPTMTKNVVLAKVHQALDDAGG